MILLDRRIVFVWIATLARSISGVNPGPLEAGVPMAAPCYRGFPSNQWRCHVSLVRAKVSVGSQRCARMCIQFMFNVPLLWYCRADRLPYGGGCGLWQVSKVYHSGPCRSCTWSTSPCRWPQHLSWFSLHDAHVPQSQMHQ
jgi:hypothetical protein